jgi:hypothetical protein
MLSEVLTGAQMCSPDCATCDRLRGSAAAAVLMTGGKPVTMADLGAAAGIAAAEAEDHCPEGAGRVVADAYRRAADELFDEYAAVFRRVDSWPENLEAALRNLLRRLADEPATAHLLYVAPVGGDEQLRDIRELFRERYIALLTGERHRDDDDADLPLPSLQVELLVGALFRTISELVHDGRAPELPELLGDLAGVAQVFEPRVAVMA